MKSPVADHLPMQREELEPGLVVHRCTQTGGVWVAADTYWKWLRKNPGRLPHLPASELCETELLGAEADTDAQAKLCPVSGTLMMRYRVGHGFKFHVERSANGGIWLDGGEWEQLRARNFHDELHLMFAAPWQREIREQAQSEGAEKRLRENVGDELYERLVDIRSVLSGHPARQEAIAFLTKSV